MVQAQLSDKMSIRPFELVSTFGKSHFLQVANERLRLEKIQLYEKLKYDNVESSRGAYFSLFGINEGEKKKKRKLLDRLWVNLDKADFSAQVVLGVNESTMISKLDRSEGSSWKRSSVSMGPVGSDSAMWIQSKLERRIQNDLLSTVKACIVSIQMIKEREVIGGGRRNKNSIPGSAVFTRSSQDFSERRGTYIKNMMQVGKSTSPETTTMTMTTTTSLSASMGSSAGNLERLMEAEGRGEGEERV